jgi:hypothetical protein
MRWACSTIERGYSPSEARELRAIASFHHPDGYAYGYLKMVKTPERCHARFKHFFAETIGLQRWQQKRHHHRGEVEISG